MPDVKENDDTHPMIFFTIANALTMPISLNSSHNHPRKVSEKECMLLEYLFSMTEKKRQEYFWSILYLRFGSSSDILPAHFLANFRNS